MKKLLTIAVLLSFVLMSRQGFTAEKAKKGASATAYEHASERAIFHRVGDWFATIGKSAEEKARIREERRLKRELKYTEKEAKRAQKEERKVREKKRRLQRQHKGLKEGFNKTQTQTKSRNRIRSRTKSRSRSGR